MTSLFWKIWAAGPGRKSRFHDAKGQRMPFAHVLHAPAALASTLMRVCLGRVSSTPWLGYSAVHRINSLLSREWSVLEFGAGRSTAWFARRVRSVVSVEHDPEWIEFVRGQLAARGIGNVVLKQRVEADYAMLDDVPDSSIDFALVDGLCRDRCVRTALAKVRKGGHIYLDNSDKTSSPVDGDPREAGRLLCEAAAAAGTKPESYVDFASGQFYASEGLLVHL